MSFRKYSGLIIGLTLLVTIIACYFNQRVKFDVSVDALALTQDLNSGSYQLARKYFGEDESIAVLVENHDPFQNIDEISKLQQQLLKIPTIIEADSFINVPLLFSPPIYLLELNLPLPNFTSETTDKTMAKKEFVNNPYYHKMIMSTDYRISTIVLELMPQSKINRSIFKRKGELELQKIKNGLSQSQQEELHDLKIKTQKLTQKRNHIVADTIEQVRTVTHQFKHLGKIFLVGIPVVTQDILNFMLEDLLYLGSLSFLSMLLVLIVIFKKLKPIFIVMSTGIISVIWATGVIGLNNRHLTIVSSNFPPLLFIIGLSMSLYVMMRYFEIQSEQPSENSTAVFETVKKVIEPCGYSALTTIVGFVSLLISDISPIVDFGFIMSLGLLITFILCFVFIPSCIIILNPQTTLKLKTPGKWCYTLLNMNDHYRRHIILAFLTLLVIFSFGIFHLKVENRFIDYFKPHTNIVKGLLIVDQKLAGSTTLEVLLESNQPNYWISDEGRTEIKDIHVWLEAQPEIQKVMSFHTFDSTMEKINRNPLKLPMMKMILNHMSDDNERVLVEPYLANNQQFARLVAYIADSNQALDRNALIKRIESKLNTLENKTIKSNVTGVYWLYNNVLQSLFDSQIKTIIMVYYCIGLMLLILFRSWKITLLILYPNFIPVTVVLGLLGWLNIPLDFMTITIAAISVGLSVDFAIQFIYRLREELNKKRTLDDALINTYNSVGRAILTTTITTSIGFILFIFSNFNPLLYFGCLTSLAILLAGAATLTLIPCIIKTFGTKLLT